MGPEPHRQAAGDLPGRLVVDAGSFGRGISTIVSVAGTNSTILENFGGGIFTRGSVAATDSMILDNGFQGIRALGDVTVTASTISRNSGSGIDANDVTVTASTISENSGRGGVIDGSGIDANGDVTVANGLAWSPDMRHLYWADTAQQLERLAERGASGMKCPRSSPTRCSTHLPYKAPGPNFPARFRPNTTACWTALATIFRPLFPAKTMISGRQPWRDLKGNDTNLITQVI